MTSKHSKIRIRSLALAAGLMTAFGAQAGAPTDILGKYACSGCHAVDTKIVGPAFAEVAAKYKDKEDLKGYLTQSIRSGGMGKWGQIPMPPQPAITDEELQQVVDWLAAGATP
ncbi:MAG: c-type cytochrome [Nevskiales bacterium]|nr:c-type cytochrome [Nevskiales bacterium]